MTVTGVTLTPRPPSVVAQPMSRLTTAFDAAGPSSASARRRASSARSRRHARIVEHVMEHVVPMSRPCRRSRPARAATRSRRRRAGAAGHHARHARAARFLEDARVVEHLAAAGTRASTRAPPSPRSCRRRPRCAATTVHPVVAAQRTRATASASPTISTRSRLLGEVAARCRRRPRRRTARRRRRGADRRQPTTRGAAGSIGRARRAQRGRVRTREQGRNDERARPRPAPRCGARPARRRRARTRRPAPTAAEVRRARIAAFEVGRTEIDRRGQPGAPAIRHERRQLGSRPATPARSTSGARRAPRRARRPGNDAVTTGTPAPSRLSTSPSTAPARPRVERAGEHDATGGRIGGGAGGPVLAHRRPHVEQLGLVGWRHRMRARAQPHDERRERGHVDPRTDARPQPPGRVPDLPRDELHRDRRTWGRTRRPPSSDCPRTTRRPRGRGRASSVTTTSGASARIVASSREARPGEMDRPAVAAPVASAAREGDARFDARGARGGSRGGAASRHRPRSALAREEHHDRPARERRPAALGRRLAAARSPGTDRARARPGSTSTEPSATSTRPSRTANVDIRPHEHCTAATARPRPRRRAATRVSSAAIRRGPGSSRPARAPRSRPRYPTTGAARRASSTLEPFAHALVDHQALGHDEPRLRAGITHPTPRRPSPAWPAKRTGRPGIRVPER